MQDNHSYSVRSTLRGLHAQLRRPQGKLLRVVLGEILDVAVDIRPESPTFGHWVSAVLSGENHHQLWVPPGFAHGFCVTSDTAHVLYKCTTLYDRDDEIAIAWNDPAIGVVWPTGTPLLSARDQAALPLAEVVHQSAKHGKLSAETAAGRGMPACDGARLRATVAADPAGDLFSPRDLRQMAEMGIAPAEAARQVEIFRHPPPYTRVLRPCRPGDGIRALAAAITPACSAILTPRRAAAARPSSSPPPAPPRGCSRTSSPSWRARRGPSPAPRCGRCSSSSPASPSATTSPPPSTRTRSPRGVRKRDWRRVLAALVESAARPGSATPTAPRGSSPSTAIRRAPRTPFEEHLIEAAAMTRADDGLCLLHFTVSPRAPGGIRAPARPRPPGLEERYDCRFEVSFSTQRHATDTLAVDLGDRPFRLADGSLLFRPGGHGALLDNLNELGQDGWDIVLLKNIDNVVPDDRKPVVHLWKRLLGGCLLAVREQTFAHLDRLEALDGVKGKRAEGVLCEAAEFLDRELCRPLPAGFAQAPLRERQRFLTDALDAADPRLRRGAQPGRAGRRPLLGRVAGGRDLAADRRGLADRPPRRRPAGDPRRRHPLQSGRHRLRPARPPRPPLRPAPLRRSRGHLHRREVPRRDSRSRRSSAPASGTAPWPAGAPSSSRSPTPPSRRSRRCSTCCGRSISRRGESLLGEGLRPVEPPALRRDASPPRACVSTSWRGGALRYGLIVGCRLRAPRKVRCVRRAHPTGTSGSAMSRHPPQACGEGRGALRRAGRPATPAP